MHSRKLGFGMAIVVTSMFVPEARAESGSALALIGPGSSMMEATLAGKLAEARSESGETPVEAPSNSGGAVKVEDGAISIEKAYEGDLPGGLSGKVETKIKFDRCPNSDGRVSISLSSRSVVSRKGGTANATVNVTVDGILQFDDEARNAGLVADTNVDYTASGSESGGKANIRWTRVGDTPVRDRIVNTPGGEATAGAVDIADSIRATAELAAGQIVIGIERAIENGHCVTLSVETTPSKRSKVAPSTAFDVLAKPRARMDGQPTGGTVVATLQGGATLNPANTRVRADAQFSYGAPGTANQKASVNLVARSKRGVGLASVDFDTDTAAFFASGGANAYHGEGNICDFSKPFVISGSGVTNTFTPTDATHGTYAYEGVLGGFAVWGKGSYVVTLSPDGSAGKLVSSGGGSVKTPMGVFRNEGSEVYELTPGTPCS
ncbi:hypothetical protein [Rhizobium paknamense]|uniref:PA14 domain-containing protein n=1 Tax=Rhizobium paknamense TaxID=1206817 RepID=A0ABU0IHU6_9HYPH|nr:hypothetical protein [Rhizobium paknamense]MDQ0457751.1 hypothetical protein [Rhizobium paknamense]